MSVLDHPELLISYRSAIHFDIEYHKDVNVDEQLQRILQMISDLFPATKISFERFEVSRRVGPSLLQIIANLCLEDMINENKENER